MSELEKTKQWFEQAIPNPTEEQKCIQVGCHLEEVAEMVNSIGEEGLAGRLDFYSSEFKACKPVPVALLSRMSSGSRVDLFDAMLDQIVTAVGVCHMMEFDVMTGLAEVNRSNFSKFEDGKAVFDENGKIKKGKYYTSPELKRFINPTNETGE